MNAGERVLTKLAEQSEGMYSWDFHGLFWSKGSTYRVLGALVDAGLALQVEEKEGLSRHFRYVITPAGVARASEIHNASLRNG